jgi:hypothetical protein
VATGTTARGSAGEPAARPQDSPAKRS